MTGYIENKTFKLTFGHDKNKLNKENKKKNVAYSYIFLSD